MPSKGRENKSMASRRRAARRLMRAGVEAFCAGAIGHFEPLMQHCMALVETCEAGSLPELLHHLKDKQLRTMMIARQARLFWEQPDKDAVVFIDDAGAVQGIMFSVQPSIAPLTSINHETEYQRVLKALQTTKPRARQQPQQPALPEAGYIQ